MLAYDGRRCICSVSDNTSKLLLADSDVCKSISASSASRRFPCVSLWCGTHEILDPFTSVLRDDSVTDNIEASESRESDRVWGVTPASNSL